MLTKSEKLKMENYSSLEVKLQKSTNSFAPSLQKVSSIGLRQQCEILLLGVKICLKYPLWTLLDSCNLHLSSKFSLTELLVCSKKCKNVTHNNICLEKSSPTPQVFSKMVKYKTQYS